MPTTLNSGLQLPDKGSVDWYSSMQSNYNLIDTHLGNTDVHVTAEDKANWNSKQGSLSQAQLDAIAQVATNTSDIATLQSGKANASHTHSSSDITDIGDYATKQYVDNSISGLVDSAPDALNTLNELSAALNDDANFASTVATALSAKANSVDLATVAISGSYNDLSNKPTINNSTITIQKNGSTVDTFTTNGSAKTINIPVPTKTSDLTNDSNFVDTSNSAVASGITSAKVTDYDSHIADTDIHVTTSDKATWNTVTSKANDNAVVHTSGDETSTGFKQFANIRANNSIKGINLADTTTDLDNCYSDFAPYGESKGGNIQYYYCNTDAGTANISNLPEAKAFFLTSITTRLISNSLYVKQILINTNSKTYTRYCANSTWSSWVNETDSEYVHKSDNETIAGIKTFSNDLIVANTDTTANTPNLSLRNYNADRGTTETAVQTIMFSDKNAKALTLLESRRISNGNTATNILCYNTDTNNNTVSGGVAIIKSQTETNFAPNADNAVTCGRPLARWSKVYGIEYYYGNPSVEFSTKFVTTDTAQTISGVKTFSDDTYVKSLNFTNEVASTSSSSSAILPLVTTVTYTDQSPSQSAILNLRITADGGKAFYPNENGQYSFGTASRRWSTIFGSFVNLGGLYFGNEFSSNARTNLYLLANRDASGQSGVYISKFRQNRAQGGMGTDDVVQVSFDVLENSVRTNRSWYLSYSNWTNDVPKTVEVRSLCEKVDYKLTHINALEPSALSMPDLANGIDISSYFDLSIYTGQTYTPSVNGWISISITSPNRGSLLCESTGISQTAYGVTDPDDNSKYRVSILVPCQKNQVLTTYVRASGGTINSAKFYPCQGNV